MIHNVNMVQVSVLLLTAVVVVVAHRPHPKLTPPRSEERAAPLARIKGDYRKVGCSDALSRERAAIIERASCAEPRDVFVHLDPQYAHEEVSPGAVWVKRCVGLCEYEAAGACVPLQVAVRNVPIRIYNAKTDKETCAVFPVEEHVSCGCCAGGAGCSAPRVYNPRKCSCRCPDADARRLCLRKRNQNMRWNRYKCACEARRRLHE